MLFVKLQYLIRSLSRDLSNTDQFIIIIQVEHSLEYIELYVIGIRFNLFLLIKMLLLFIFVPSDLSITLI
jgi:hypothetical protein